MLEKGLSNTVLVELRDEIESELEERSQSAMESASITQQTFGADGLRQIAHKCIKELIEDIFDRRGIKHEWHAINEDIKNEIKDKWESIIVRNFTKC